MLTARFEWLCPKQLHSPSSGWRNHNSHEHMCESCHLNLQVYCLPDGYEVVERSLDDVRYVLNPTFSPTEVAGLDKDVSWARTLDGAEYMPGLVGLNDMRANDYANVIIQVCHLQAHAPREGDRGRGALANLQKQFHGIVNGMM